MDSARQNTLVTNKSADAIAALIPLTQGATIYARNTYGAYYVNGYTS